MNSDDAKRFEEELEASGGDIELWQARKERENSTFTGLEMNPEKEKRLNEIKQLCRQLESMNSDIIYTAMPFDSNTRHGGAQISFPPLILNTDKRITQTMAQIFARADHFTMSAPKLINDNEYEDEDETYTGERGGREILITFYVADMWQTYGKAPFGI